MKLLGKQVTRVRLRRAGLSRFEAILLVRLGKEPADLATLVSLAGEAGIDEALISISLREYTAGTLARLENAGLVADDGQRYTTTHRGTALLRQLDPLPDSIEEPSPAIASKTTIIVYLASIGVLLPLGLLTGSAELLALAFLLGSFIGSFLLAWHGIRTHREKRAAMTIGSGTLGLGLVLVALGLVSLFDPFIVRRLFHVSLTILALASTAIALFALSRTQAAIGKEHSSFSFAALSHSSLRQSLLAGVAIFACLSSYISLHFVVSFFLLAVGLRMLVNAGRMLEALRKRTSAQTAIIHWFEHQARKSREIFFLSWLEQLLDERSATRKEIMAIYQENFVRQTTPFFDEINVNLSRDAWFDEHLDRLLGHLLYDERIRIGDAGFVRKYGN